MRGRFFCEKLQSPPTPTSPTPNPYPLTGEGKIENRGEAKRSCNCISNLYKSYYFIPYLYYHDYDKDVIDYARDLAKSSSGLSKQV